MTERLYYTDASCANFDAVVTKTASHDGRPAAFLDRTAFYPTSGGQPYDTGRLGSSEVVETIDKDDEGVMHVLSSPLEKGARVHGEINWVRRFDHMQQHTGQHVLSAAFDRLFDAATVSFHLGTDTVSIDLAKEVSAEQIARAEAEANTVVWEDRPVAVRFASAEEAAALPLRKDPSRSGTLRLIEIPGFDLSACGGTHVSRTGAVGIIAVTAVERFRGGSRLTFACGGRALRAFQLYRDTVSRSLHLLSVQPEELPAAIERAQGDARDLRRTVKHLQESLAVHEAGRLVQEASPRNGVRCVIEGLDGWDANGLKAIASAATAGDDVAVALFSTTVPAVVVIARSRNVNLDAQAVLNELTGQFGGRGGGKPDLAQGGGLNADTQMLLAAAQTLIDRQLHGGT